MVMVNLGRQKERHSCVVAAGVGQRSSSVELLRDDLQTFTPVSLDNWLHSFSGEFHRIQEASV